MNLLVVLAVFGLLGCQTEKGLIVLHYAREDGSEVKVVQRPDAQIEVLEKGAAGGSFVKNPHFYDSDPHAIKEIGESIKSKLIVPEPWKQHTTVRITRDWFHVVPPGRPTVRVAKGNIILEHYLGPRMIAFGPRDRLN